MALTILQTALRVSRDVVKTIDGRSVTIARGAESTVVTATLGETRSEDFLEENLISTVRVRDFLIDVADYKFAIAGTVKPVTGDLITYDGEKWIVQPLAAEPEARPHGRDTSTWRIHTKKLGTA